MTRRIAALMLAVAAAAIGAGLSNAAPHPVQAVAADYDKWGKIAFPDGPPVVIGSGRP